MRVALLLALATSTHAFLAPLAPVRMTNVELAAKKKKKKQVMSPSGDGVQATVLIEKADAAAADAMDLGKQAAALADDGAAKAAAKAAEDAEAEAAKAAAETAAKKAAAEAAAREKEALEREKAAAAQRAKEEQEARDAEAARLAARAKAEAEAKAKAEEEARIAAEKEVQAAAAAQKAKEEEAAREAESARLAAKAKAEAEAKAKAEEEARIAAEKEAARIAAEKKAAEEVAARGDLVLAAAEAAASWPPDAAIGPLQDALAKAAALGITDGNDVDAAKDAIAAAERIAALAAEGEGVQPRRKAAAKAAQDWQVARKVQSLREEGEKVISERAEGAQKLQAYVKETRASSIVGDWADSEGMLCRLKADGTVLVPPSRGSGGAWKLTNEDGFGASVEITLALAQTTRNGVPAGNRDHTLKGSISGRKMTGAVETTMFGSVAAGDLDLTKM